MAQKADISQNQKAPDAPDLSKIMTDYPKDLPAGIRPYLEDPHQAVRRAIRRAVLSALIIAMTTGALVLYAAGRIKKEADNLQSAQNLIYLAAKQAEAGAALERQYEKISPHLDKINAALPAGNDLLNYMGALDALAKETQAEQAVKFQVQASGAPSNLPTKDKTKTEQAGVEHTIELKGNFDKITNYLAGLEKLPYFIKIVNFNLNGSKGLANEAAATLTVKIFTDEKEKK